jgi:hypothetical protein
MTAPASISVVRPALYLAHETSRAKEHLRPLECTSCVSIDLIEIGIPPKALWCALQPYRFCRY